MATAHRSPYAPPVGGFVDDIEKGHQLHEFGDAIIRQGFVRKVFGGVFPADLYAPWKVLGFNMHLPSFLPGLLAVQLAATVAIGGLIVGSPAVKAAVLSGPVLLAAFALSLGPLLYMCKFLGHYGSTKRSSTCHPYHPPNPLHATCVATPMRTLFHVSPLPCTAFSEKARHQFPKNVILMAVFTIGEGVLVGAATSRCDSTSAG